MAQPAWQWAEQYGGSSTGIRSAAIAVDLSGNSHVTGRFAGTAVFDSVTLTSAGDNDAFVTKVDANGNLLWATSAGGAANVFGQGIAVDGSGNVFVTGSFAGSATFGSPMGVSQTVTAPNGGSVFLAKYNSAGALQWVRSGAGGMNYRDESFAVTTDANGNAYITGYFTGTAEFGNLSPLATAGWWDIFVVAYDGNGNELWATSAGGANSGYYSEAGRGIAVDNSGNVYVSGHFIGTADFGSITLTAISPTTWPRFPDMFLGRYNPVAGDWDWVVHGGGQDGARATDLQIDAWNNLYVAGIFSGTATIGTATMTASPSRNSEYFVGKTDSGGNFEWVVQSGGTSFHSGHGIGLDPAGNVYLAATFQGTEMVGNTAVTSQQWDNVYVTKISPSGNFEWVVHSPGNYYHVASDVGADAFGNVYATGWFQGGATFDAIQMSSPGTSNVFVARLGDCEEWQLHCPPDFGIDDCPAAVPDLTGEVFIESECWTASDFIVTQDPPPGDLLNEGPNTITISVISPDGEERECRVVVNVRCPPCDTQSILLNTGYDHTAGGVYPIGAADAFWSVVADTNPNTTEPRPADVVNAYGSSWAPALPDSQWINAYPTNRNDRNAPYDFQTTFCLGDDWRDVQLEVCLRADDEAEVFLNDSPIVATPNPSFGTPSPTCITITNQSLFQAGQNTLTVRVINTSSIAMGLNLAAEVTGTGLQDPRCCLTDSSLSGQKFDDFHGTGVMDFGDQPLAGWTIELTDGFNTWTTVTDGSGFYHFMGLLPGAYTINEVQQPGWAQTAPPGGTHTVTLGASQAINELNFGNQPCVQIQCPNFEPFPCQGPDGTFLDLEVIATSGCGDIVELECDYDLSGPFWPGTTVVNCIATDSEGNTAECQFEITVVPDDQWDIRCPDPILIESCDGVVPDLTDTISFDNNCWPLADFQITQDPPAGTPIGEGTHPVFVTVEGPDGTKRECEVMVTVRCPRCETNNVSLNTGFNHAGGGVYPIGAGDAYWSVVDDPDAGATVPRPANVVAPHPTWAPALLDSQWISVFPTLDNDFANSYDLETTFCLLEGDWSGLALDLCLRAAGMAEVYLNGDLIGATPDPAHDTANPTCFNVSNPLNFVWGTNTLRVRIFNTTGDAMGVNIAASVSSDNPVLENPNCCQPESSIFGQKFHDVNGNGAWNAGEPALAGWTIELTDGANTWTTMTDVNGFYYFMNLAPGAYTVSEVQQSGWTQTAPATGTHTVALNASQSVSGLHFGNFTGDVRNYPPELTCPEDVSIACEEASSGTSLTVQMSDSDGDQLDYVWNVNGTPVQVGSVPAGGPPTVGSSTLTYNFLPGTNIVTFIVTDEAGNEAMCRIRVTVRDSEPPSLRCPDGIITLSAGDDCVAIVPNLTLGAWDNCTPRDELIIIQDPPAGTALPPGMHTVLVTVSDLAGNESHCRAEVRVQDRTPPTVVCPEPMEVEGCDGVIPDLIGEADVWDNCDDIAALDISQSPPAGTAVGPGSHAITITAVDSSGNSSSCSTTFTVVATGSAAAIELFNTGVDGNGNILPAGDVDLNFALTSSADPAFPGPDAYVVTSQPNAWIANDATSHWISPRPDAANTNTSGVYVYRKTFTLPANMTGASISGRWLTDNKAEIRLNGAPTGDTKPANGFSMWTNFNITSGFNPGQNVLEFVVTAMPSSAGVDYHTGLRVELRGEVTFCEEPCVAPHIVQQAGSLTRVVGSTASFTVSAGGSGPLTYQWYHNGSPISGANGPTLTISPVSFSDAGAYHVLVTNDCGEIVSRQATLRVTRLRPTVVGQWDFEPGDPLRATVGYDIEFLDAGNEDYYQSTAAFTRFGSTASAGDSGDPAFSDIPGMDGQPVNVMRFSRTGPNLGYLVRADAPAEGHTIVFDLLIPRESVAAYPLLQANVANDTPADVYLTAGNENTQSGAATGGQNDPPGLRPNTWNRVAVTVDLEAPRPVMTWFINGDMAGREFLSEERLADWEQPEGPKSLLLFTDSFDEEMIGYVSSIQWHNAVLCDLEVAALGRPSPGGAPLVSPYLLEPNVVLEPDRGRGELIFYWLGDGFRLQESGDLRTWTDVDVTPHVEIIDDEIVREVVLPIPDDTQRFYRVTED